jgi:putative copper resistance protein D
MTGLAVVRAIHLAAAIQTIGALLFVWIVEDAPLLRFRPRTSTLSGLLVRLALLCVVIVAASGAAWFALQIADMTEGSLGEAWTSGAVSAVLFKTRAGIIWWVRLAIVIALAIVMLALARGAPNRAAVVAALTLAIANLTTCAWLSHAAGDAGPFGALHLGIHAAHTLGVAVWVGGLIPLAMVLSTMQSACDNDAAAFVHRLGVRFGNIALLSVALIVLTGIANTALVVQDASDPESGTYAKLLAAKLLLFLIMLVLATANRQWLVPRLTDGKPSHAAMWLRRSVLAEAALAAVVLLIVGALGITAPGAATD